MNQSGDDACSSTKRELFEIGTIPPYSPTIADYDQERRFIETLLAQRFNFLIVFFGVSAVVAINSRNEWVRVVLWIVAAAIGTVIALAVNRGQRKFDVLFDVIGSHASHPATYSDVFLEQHAPKNIWERLGRRSRRKLIGYYLPWVFVGLQVLGAIVSAIVAFCKG